MHLGKSSLKASFLGSHQQFYLNISSLEKAELEMWQPSYGK